MKKRQMPKTQAEWQDAVDAAWALLGIDSARQYGLVTGGPEVNVANCLDMVRKGEAWGITPSDDANKRFIAEYNASVEAHRNGEPVGLAVAGGVH